MNIKKILVTSMAGLLLGGLPIASGSMVVSADELTNTTIGTDEISYISNEEIFNGLFREGYDVREFLSDEEYQNALMEDTLYRGGTYIKWHKGGGYTVYLNSAVCKVVIALGLGGVAAVVTALSATGVGASIAGPIDVSAGYLIPQMGATASQRGVWIKYNKFGLKTGLGYQ